MSEVREGRADEEAILAIRAEFLRRAAGLAGGALACRPGSRDGACPHPGASLAARQACRLAAQAGRMEPACVAEVLLSGRGPSGTPLDGPALRLGNPAAVEAWLGAGDADPSTIAETCGGRDRRRLRGSYYTEPAAVSLMVRLAFWACARGRLGDGDRAAGLDGLPAGIRIVDPACGSGAFLAGAFDELTRVASDGTSAARREGPGEGRGSDARLHGVDSDPVAVAACRHAMWLRACRRGGCPFDAPVEIGYGDALLDDPPMPRGWYDIVLMNPPYVRHELIPAQLKSKLRVMFPSFAARSDLYVYFFAVAERLLRPGGVAAVICPTAWMHVGYGAQVTSYLAERFDVLAVLRSEVERWFPGASVDAGIVLLRKRAAAGSSGRPAVVVRLREPLSELPWDRLAAALVRPGAGRAGGSGGAFDVAVVDSGGLPTGNWGPVFHPTPLREFLAAAGRAGRLRRLGDIAGVRRGFTTGANGFFYVTPAQEAREGARGRARDHGDSGLKCVAPSGLRGRTMVFRLPEAALHPLIRSPREVRGYVVRPADLRHLVMVIRPEEVGALPDGHDCAAFIRWGERCGFARRPTCAARSPWWALRPAAPPPVVWAMTIRERFFAAVNCGALLDARLYGISPADGTDAVLLAAMLNSSIVALQAEQGCRTYGGGGGPLDTKVYEVRGILIPDPSRLPPDEAAAILSAFREMMSRDVLPVQEECGMEDRARLDEAVLRACGVPAAAIERLAKEARDALCESVAGRTARARRVISP